MDVCNLPQTVKAEISSYLYKYEILQCCHVSQKWYHSFNENYLFKNSRPEPDTSFKQDELDKMMPNAHDIDNICNQFHHCQMLREYLLQKIARTRMSEKFNEDSQELFKLVLDIYETTENCNDKLRQALIKRRELGQNRSEQIQKNRYGKEILETTSDLRLKVREESSGCETRKILSENEKELAKVKEEVENLKKLQSKILDEYNSLELEIDKLEQNLTTKKTDICLKINMLKNLAKEDTDIISAVNDVIQSFNMIWS